MSLIRERTDLLKSLTGLTISSCCRLFEPYGDSDFIPSNIRDQELDAITVLKFSNKHLLGFYPDTSKFTLSVKEHVLGDLPKGLVNVSSNSFWQGVIGKKILAVNLLFGIIEEPYGIRFELENNLKFELQYVSETEYTFDALIIR